MPDWITGPAPYETPLESAEPGYEKIAPSFGESFGAMFQQNSAISALQGAAERGAQQGASWFDRALVDTSMAQAGQVIPDPTPSPTLSAAEINRKYAPEGTTITNKPMSEGLAQVLAQQKAQQIDREGVLARYAQHTGPVTRFAAAAAAFVLDPLNLATGFVPGVGEDAIAAKLGYASARAAPLAARVGIRLGAGATAGIAAQAPLSALRYGLSQEEDGDYSIRSAMADLAFGGALGAAGHAVFGGLGDILHGPGGRTPPEPTLDAPPMTRHAAMGVSVSQMVDGRPVDVEPVFDENGARSTAAALETRQRYAGVGVTPQETEVLARQDISEYRYANSTQSKSIFQAMRDLGGLKVRNADGSPTPGPDVQGALENVDRKPPGLINNQKGLTPERMHEALAEQGWFGVRDEDPEALVRAIEQQGRGQAVLHPNDEAAYPSQQRAAIEDELSRAGVAAGDDLETASKKLGNWRGEQAFEDLKAHAGQLGVPYHALTSPEDLLGDVLEREAIQHDPRSPAELADAQKRLYENGFAQGIPQDEFDRLNDEIYGPKAEEREPGATDAAQKAAKPTGSVGEQPRSEADVELAELERHWASADQHLLPEEHAELQATEAALARAEQQGRGLEQAASCLGRAGV